MKKHGKRLIIVIILVILVGVTFAVIDYNRTKNNQKPIFTLKIGTFRDGGSQEYIGLGYKVIRYNTLSGYKENKFGSWFMRYDAPEIKEEDLYSFTGYIIETSENSAIVEPAKEEAIRNSSDKIAISLEGYENYSFKAGDFIKVDFKGEVRESYPASVDCIQIEVVPDRKILDMYTLVLKSILEEDVALHYNAEFLSIDIDTFVRPLLKNEEVIGNSNKYSPISDATIQGLMSYCYEFYSNVKQDNFEELKEQGYFDEEQMSLSGLLIYITDIEVLEEDKVIFTAVKYRSGLGAIFPKYELKYKNDKWEIKLVEMAIS